MELEGPREVVKTDRFGFIIRDLVATAITEREIRHESQRNEKWRKMLTKWSTANELVTSRKFRSRVAKGIPESFRGLAWLQLERAMQGSRVESPAVVAISKAKTELLALPNGENIYEAISKDLGRTLPQHLFFRAFAGRQALENVLCAYAVFDLEVGFTQGMSFLAALFLLYVNEDQAFNLLKSTMYFAPCNLRGMFVPGMGGVHLRLFQYSKLLQVRLPKINIHFEQLGFEPVMYAVNWFASVFTASPFPFPVIVRIWDLFLMDGWPVVFAVTIAFWKLINKRILVATRLEDVFEIYRAVLASDFLLTRIDTLFETALRFKITEQELVRLELEFKR